MATVKNINGQWLITVTESEIWFIQKENETLVNWGKLYIGENWIGGTAEPQLIDCEIEYNKILKENE